RISLDGLKIVVDCANGAAYKVAPEVTRRRMYLEALGSVLGSADKVIVDTGAGGTGVVPYLPLPELQKRHQSGEQPATNQ
ncbi:MAG: hypothetical protein KAT39_07095, partial [Alphaproteobacteria bacterium]|nr:hypothetical protein [Alphaproteobacteria bacterium]